MIEFDLLDGWAIVVVAKCGEPNDLQRDGLVAS